MSPSCSYYRRIAITATAMLMAGCASSSESDGAGFTSDGARLDGDRGHDGS
jgi:hypothetical protein